MFKKIWNAISTIIVLIMVILALLLVGVRLIGLHPYSVTSGSMSPAYAVGSLIYVKPAQPQDVKKGDPITFFLHNDSIVATHRVIEIDSENQCFYTKGDANETPDGAPVSFENLIGKPVMCLPVLGYVSSFMTRPPGLYVAISAVLVIVLLTLLPDILKKAEQHDRKNTDKQQTKKGCLCKAAKRQT